MVYTLTMHPAVDLFLHAQGDVPERRGAAVQAGGKGVNVSRFLRRLGRPSRCVVLCGGARGQFLCASLAEEGLDVLPVDDPKGFCRINLKCTGAHEQALDGRGRAGANAAERVLSLLASLLRSGDLLAACGSLPDGIDSGFYAAAVRLARKRTRRSSSTPPGTRCARRSKPPHPCCAATVRRLPLSPPVRTRKTRRGKLSHGARRQRWSPTAKTARISARTAGSFSNRRSALKFSIPSARATRSPLPASTGYCAACAGRHCCPAV